MRAPSAGQGLRRRTRVLAGRIGATLLTACALVTASGCAKRFALEPKELEKVQLEADVNPLRVYASKRFVSIWYEEQVAEAFEVDREIREASARQRLKNVTSKKVAGKIIAMEESNGMPLLFVSFDSSCTEKKCSFSFVQTEDGRYRLVQAPPLEGYTDPKNYYACLHKKRLMKLGKMKSLGEANDVLVWKKRNGKLRTVHLEVVKVVDDRTRTRTRRSGGFD